MYNIDKEGNAKMANKLLDNAKRNKADEFYTQLSDIEAEMKRYRNHFKGKTVFCNCDDPYESNFFKYFAMNFNFLGLKKLIATCYAGSPIANRQLSLFDDEPIGNKTTGNAHKIIITEVNDENKDGAIDLADVEWLCRNKKNTLTRLNGDGDFRSEECLELLKEADIVVTNPPFSLFREYVAQLIKNDKKFVIIGSKNAITYKEIFKLIKDNQMWLGGQFPNGNAYFRIPAQYSRDWANGVFNEETGLVKFRNCGWFTNLDYKERHEELTLYERYNPEKFPKYENFDAINSDKTSEIPYDYDGVIGVPITFLDKYNPDQFEIIGLGITGSCNFTSNRKMDILDADGNPTGKTTFNAKGTLYKKYNPKTDTRPAFKDSETGVLYSSIYARILIRRK